MKASDLKAKTVQQLKGELLELRREQFNLRMQHATGQLQKTDQVARVRKNIARVKTVLNQKAAAGER
jgi:large subunit ribosomal protein L29